jgi:triosephosphate isomerase
MDCQQIKSSIEARLIEGAEGQFENALSHISSAIETARRSFAPVLAVEPPEAPRPSAGAQSKPQEISRFDKMVEHVTSRMHEQAEEITIICGRSRV